MVREVELGLNAAPGLPSTPAPPRTLACAHLQIPKGVVRGHFRLEVERRKAWPSLAWESEAWGAESLFCDRYRGWCHQVLKVLK